jgi:hypothetical protein
MAVNLSPVGGVAAQFFTNTGAVLTGGKLYTYLAGTTTPTPTYTTSAGNVARTNPIVLDAAGRVPGSGEIWLTVGTTYKFVLKDSDDVLIGTYDNITSAFNTDASLVVYTPAGAGAVTTNVQAKLREVVSVKDFGAVGNGTTNDTAAFTAALSAITASEGTVFVPQGVYLITGSLDVQRNCSLTFSPGTIIKFNSTDFYVFRAHRGTTLIGNGVRIEIINATWDGGAIFLDGTNRFAPDEPTILDGFNVEGIVGSLKGTGLYLTAQDARDFISFVQFSNFSFYNLNYGVIMTCGSSGDPAIVDTWHWINGNVFNNFTFFGTSHGILLDGLTEVPAEVAGNIFNNFEFQVGTSTTKFPVYAFGASSNVFNNFYVWDWIYATSNPIVFAGGANSNQVTSNVDPVYVTTNGINVAAKNGTGSVSQLTSFGNVSIRDLSVLKIGYVGLEATIGGADTLTITPRTGYTTQVASIFSPTTDNTFNLGTAGLRWATVFAGTGTINTSDAREKQQVRELADAEKAVALRLKGLLKAFKFNNAVEAKGDGARIHFGVMAQDVKEAFEAEGLDASNYALFCYDEWQDDEKLNVVAGNRYGIRYDELLAFIIGAI